ncbi:hypothetical protein T439DRAFT_361052 [Meredithblackwellia eburnea MCA 4105]
MAEFHLISGSYHHQGLCAWIIRIAPVGYDPQWGGHRIDSDSGRTFNIATDPSFGPQIRSHLSERLHLDTLNFQDQAPVTGGVSDPHVEAALRILKFSLRGSVPVWVTISLHSHVITLHIGAQLPLNGPFVKQMCYDDLKLSIRYRDSPNAHSATARGAHQWHFEVDQHLEMQDGSVSVVPVAHIEVRNTQGMQSRIIDIERDFQHEPLYGGGCPKSFIAGCLLFMGGWLIKSKFQDPAIKIQITTGSRTSNLSNPTCHIFVNQILDLSRHTSPQLVLESPSKNLAITYERSCPVVPLLPQWIGIVTMKVTQPVNGVIITKDIRVGTVVISTDPLLLQAATTIVEGSHTMEVTMRALDREGNGTFIFVHFSQPVEASSTMLLGKPSHLLLAGFVACVLAGPIRLEGVRKELPRREESADSYQVGVAYKALIKNLGKGREFCSAYLAESYDATSTFHSTSTSTIVRPTRVSVSVVSTETPEPAVTTYTSTIMKTYPAKITVTDAAPLLHQQAWSWKPTPAAICSAINTIFDLNSA